MADPSFPTGFRPRIRPKFGAGEGDDMGRGLAARSPESLIEARIRWYEEISSLYPREVDRTGWSPPAGWDFYGWCERNGIEIDLKVVDVPFFDDSTLAKRKQYARARGRAWSRGKTANGKDRRKRHVKQMDFLKKKEA